MGRVQVGIARRHSRLGGLDRGIEGDVGREIAKVWPRDAHTVSQAKDRVVTEPILELNAGQNVDVTLAAWDLYQATRHKLTIRDTDLVGKE